MASGSISLFCLLEFRWLESLLLVISRSLSCFSDVWQVILIISYILIIQLPHLDKQYYVLSCYCLVVMGLEAGWVDMTSITMTASFWTEVCMYVGTLWFKKYHCFARAVCCLAFISHGIFLFQYICSSWCCREGAISCYFTVITSFFPSWTLSIWFLVVVSQWILNCSEHLSTL